MSDYPEFFNIIYRDDQRIMVLNENPEKNSANWWVTISLWWSGFNLRSKLLALATLGVSFIMTFITFFALNSIQRDAGMNDTRYARDLGLLLSGNVTELVAKGQKREIFNVAEKLLSIDHVVVVRAAIITSVIFGHYEFWLWIFKQH